MTKNTEILPFNPLDNQNLGASVAEALVSQPIHQLGELKEFWGAGIYAIYYHGRHLAYERIAACNRPVPTVPIYVGKAVPSGARKGVTIPDPTRSKTLFSRLTDHAMSIRAAASTLSIGDFTCRYLVVGEMWISLGESLMINKFSPLWNVAVEGFGNHDPGSGRYNGFRPVWDTMHPGRHWAEKCRERPETQDQIQERVIECVARISLPRTSHFIGRQDL